MSAAKKIEDENIKEAREAEKKNQNLATITDGNTDPSIHKHSVKEDENGGKTEITPYIQSSERALASIDNADALNQNLIAKTHHHLEQTVTDSENIVKSSGDHEIHSENTNKAGIGNMATEEMNDLMDNGEKAKSDSNQQHKSSKMIMEDAAPIEVICDNKTNISKAIVDDRSINDNDMTSGYVNNDDIIKNINDQSSESNKDGNIEPGTSQAVDDFNETDDDDLELKWDEGNDNFGDNDDDLIKDGMECDVRNEEQKVETLADESSMDIDFDNNDQDVLNDNPIINNDNNDVDSTIGNSIQNTEKETDNDIENDKNMDVITDNFFETNLNTSISNEIIKPNKNDVMKDPNELKKEVESPNNDETLSSQDMSMEDTSQLIKKHHGIHRPDVMLEIPTQELIDIDDTDLSINLDQSDESLDVKHSTMLDEKITDNDNTPPDDGNIIVEEPTVTVEDVNSTSLTGNVAAYTCMQENVKGLEEDVTEKGSDVVNTLAVESQVKDPNKPSSSAISNKLTLDRSEMSEVTDSLGTESSSKVPSEILAKVPEATDSLNKSVSPENLDKVAKVSDILDPLVAPNNIPPNNDDELKVSDSINSASSNNITVEISNKLSVRTDSMDTTVSTNQLTDTSNKMPEVLDSINPQDTTTNKLPDVTDSLDKSVSSNEMTPDTFDNVPKVAHSVTPQATTSIELPKVTDNLGMSVSSDKMTPDTSDNVPEVADSINSQATAAIELPNMTDNLGTSVSSDKMAPHTPDNVPEVLDSINTQATTSIEMPNVTDNFASSVSSNEMIRDTSDDLPEVSDSLGLLAESSRVMEDDDDQEDDEDGDDDDDFDQDESSNQISTAEHSEDSNAQQSETEANRDEKETEVSPAVESEREFQFLIGTVDSKGVDKTDIECIEEPIEDIIGNNEEPTEEADETLVPLEKQQVDSNQADIEAVGLSDNEADIELPAQTSEQETPKTTKEVIALPDELSKLSPSKTKKLELSSSTQPIFNIVDLEESSSEDDIQEINKEPETTPKPEDTGGIDGVTSVNLPDDIEVMCTSAGSTSEIVTKEGEVVISGVPKPPPVKLARLNTSEVSIKTTSTATESTLVIPEAKAAVNDKTSKEARVKPKLCLEIFSLDSDEEDTSSSAKEQPRTPTPPSPARDPGQCINPRCASGPQAARAPADSAARAHFGVTRRGRALLCAACALDVLHAKQNLIKGIKDFCPLLELGVDKLSQELVEISDSESEDESEEPKPPSEIIGEKGAKLLEENLAAIINETWRKYNMDARMNDTHAILDSELQKLENESKEIDEMLNECQVATDKLRNELYATFERGCEELPSFTIYDTPMYNYVGPEIEKTATPPPPQEPIRQSKRRLSIPIESPAKKPAIPLGYTPLDTDTTQRSAQETKTTAPVIENKADDDKEVSVVKLSAEAAPADLPPPGDICRPPLKVGMSVFAMRNAFGPWLSGKILECQPKHNSTSPYTMCRVKFDHKVKNPCKILSARCLAYPEPAEVRMTIGTRIIALYKDPSNLKREQYFSGIVAEIPNPVNSYRYLVFFDDGYAQYVQHCLTRLVCESSSLVWEEVHPFSRQFVKDYLMAYPERPMVRLHEGQSLKTEWNGKWWASRVAVVDASLAQVVFTEDGRREWVYRGSTRLAPLYLEFQAAGRHRPRPMPRTKAQAGFNMPYVEYTRSDEQESNKRQDIQTQQQQNEEMRRQRSVAKKSTAAPPPPAPAPAPSNLDTVTSRVVYYTPKSAIKPYKMVPHMCSSKCKRTDVLSLKELRTYNPLAKPLLSGWERQIVRFKGHKEVMYRAPCGRRLRDMGELHRYLRATHSELPVDLFDFFHGTHCLAEFVLNKCLVGKKDLSHGKENVPVPCVNYYDDSLPEFCSYNTERTPTAGVPLNLDPDFLCGCDCTDDCADKSKCACWRMTLEGARTIGLEGPNVGYEYKRLPEPLPSGIYECNSRCKCKATCLNRVAQHPLQLKLQVFKTLNRGWGIRALNDIPKGAFLCVYAGNLLTDATANLDGLNEGDEYLAELDYIEVVEQMKEGYEEDIPAADKRLDKKELGKQNDEESSEEEIPSSEDEGRASKSDKEDDDFMPGYIGLGVMTFNKALRKRDKAKKEQEDKDRGKEKEKDNAKNEEECITISDDEEVREPSRFTAQAGMGANQFISKYRSVRSHFGMDEACYIMDAKVQGNIGRYLNHSCTPNVFVQNVFVDTHDPRFPWVAFFALSHIKAGTELTWNYNYDVGSVPGKVLYCFCGAPNCRGRLL